MGTEKSRKGTKSKHRKDKKKHKKEKKSKHRTKRSSSPSSESSGSSDGERLDVTKKLQMGRGAAKATREILAYDYSLRKELRQVRQGRCRRLLPTRRFSRAFCGVSLLHLPSP
jgi:hypothetical protein